MDSCEHEYPKSWQLHLAELVCQRPMTERLVGSAVSAGRGLLERGAGKLRPKKDSPNNRQQSKNENNRSAQDKAML